MGLTMNKELGQWRYYRNERPRENLEREPQLPMAKKVGCIRPDRYIFGALKFLLSLFLL